MQKGSQGGAVTVFLELALEVAVSRKTWREGAGSVSPLVQRIYRHQEGLELDGGDKGRETSIRLPSMTGCVCFIRRRGPKPHTRLPFWMMVGLGWLH